MVPYYLLEHVLSQYLKRLWLPTAALLLYTLGGTMACDKPYLCYYITHCLPRILGSESCRYYVHSSRSLCYWFQLESLTSYAHVYAGKPCARC